MTRRSVADGSIAFIDRGMIFDESPIEQILDKYRVGSAVQRSFTVATRDRLVPWAAPTSWPPLTG